MYRTFTKVKKFGILLRLKITRNDHMDTRTVLNFPFPVPVLSTTSSYFVTPPLSFFVRSTHTNTRGNQGR